MIPQNEQAMKYSKLYRYLSGGFDLADEKKGE